MRRLIAFITAALVFLALSCSKAPAAPATAPQPAKPTASQAAQSQPSLGTLYAQSPYIVEPANFSWPRTVKDFSGQTVQIKQAPQRIVTLSLGFDEITMSLVQPERIAALTAFAGESYSNIADIAPSVKGRITRDPETIISVHPDLVVAYHLNLPELVKQPRDAGLTVVQIEGGEKLLDPAY